VKGFSFLLALFIAVLSIAGYTYGFCVYNKTSVEIEVTQTAGNRTQRGFWARIEPGKHACCNWKNKDCNTGGKRDSIVKFTVTRNDIGGINWYKTVCRDFPVKAGGWLEVKKVGDNYFCEAHFK